MRNLTEIRRFEPVLFLLYDPPERKKYSIEALKCSKFSPRILVGGSDRITPQNTIAMIKTLREYTNSPIYEFPGHHKKICGEADGIFTPCVVNSEYLKYFSDLQADAEPMLSRIYGNKVEWVCYLIQGGKVARTAKAKRLTKEQIIRRFDYWTKMGNFDWYYLEAGSGEEILPLDLILECNRVCQERHKKFIYGGGIRTFKQAQTLYKNKINIVIGNALFDPEGVLEVKKIQKHLYTAREMPAWTFILK